MRLNKIIILLFILTFSSCIDPFLPEIANYDDVLYIECLLNNDTEQPVQYLVSYKD